MVALSSIRTGAGDVVRTITIKAQTEGIDQSATSLNKLSDAQDKVSTSGERMAVVTETTTRRQISSAGAYDKFVRSIDPAANAMHRFERAQALVDKQLNMGRIGLDEHGRVLDLARAKYGLAAVANDNLTKSVGLQSYAWRNLGMQANDAATMLLSGSSAFQVVATQGGQILQVLQGAEGGLTGAFTSIRAGAMSLISPTAAAVVGVASLTGGLILAGKAGLDYADGQNAVQRSLLGLGRQSDTTVSGINAAAEASAAGARVSVAAAREMISGFAATGRISQSLFGDLTLTSARLAKTTGTDVPDAAARLAAALVDPVRGAEELNRGLGFLDGTTYQLIQRLDAQGERTKAQDLILRGMKPALADVTDLTNGWALAWGAVGLAARNAYDWTGKAVFGAARQPTLQERIATEANRPTSLPWYARIGQDEVGTGTQTRNDDALLEMQEQARRGGRSGMDDTRRSWGAENSLAAAKIIEQITPSNADILQLTKWQDLLDKVLKAGDAPTGTAEALKRIRDQLAAGGTEAFNLGRAAQDAFDQAPLLAYERGIAQINARYRDLIVSANGQEQVIVGYAKARQLEISTFNVQSIGNPLRDAGMRVDEQVAGLRVQRDSFLASTEAAAAMAAKQDLVNDAIRRNIPLTADYGSRIDELAARMAKVAAANEEFQRVKSNIVQGMDELRSGSQGLLTGAFSAARQGQSVTQALSNSLGRMGDQLFDRLVSKPLTEQLLGFAGKGGGGLLGDAASKIFGDVSGMKLPGATATGTMTVTAASVIVNGGLGTGSLPGLPGLPGVRVGLPNAGSAQEPGSVPGDYPIPPVRPGFDPLSDPGSVSFIGPRTFSESLLPLEKGLTRAAEQMRTSFDSVSDEIKAGGDGVGGSLSALAKALDSSGSAGGGGLARLFGLGGG